MTITKEIEAETLRLFHVEKWKRGTIARQLHIHHSAVDRVLTRNGISIERVKVRSAMIDAYLPFIRSVLEKYPKLTASRLYEMVRQRGYEGAQNHFRHMVSRHRPRPAAEAYLRLKTLPGEQAQVDWAHFGKITIGNAERPLYAFVMVLSWSRQIFLKFYTGMSTSCFLQGHNDAFQQWEGVPRELLYDNLKSAVLERVGDAIRFNPRLLDFAAYYKFAPKPVAVARGNQKGRVERAIQYIRHSFFAARKWNGLEDLNNQAAVWSQEFAGARKCAEDEQMTVSEAFRLEKPKLINLPDAIYPAFEYVIASVGKTPYVRFDLNDYSVPHEHVRKKVTVIADSDWVRIVDGVTQLAKHSRSYEKRRVIESLDHIMNLEEQKKKAKRGSGMNRLSNAAPSSKELFVIAAEKGHVMGGMTTKLLKLLDLYGSNETEEAIKEVLKSGGSHCSDVAQVLEKRRRQKGLLSPVAIKLPDDKRITDLVVLPHDLAEYDELSNEERN